MSFNRTRIALAIASGLLATTAGAAVRSHSRFTPLNIHAVPISHPANQFVGQDGRAGVILVLKGEPAAAAYARALNAGGNGTMALSAAGHASQTAMASIKTAQATFVKALNASGIRYTEMYRVQRVLNAIAVRMSPADMAKARKLPDVAHVAFLPNDKPSNITSVPFIDAPTVWQGTNLPYGVTGSGMRIGDIDTGLDYIHPDFGGDGTLASYQNVDPTSTIGQNSGTPIFPTSKVVGGHDFVGDAYNGITNPTAVPDDNPMDCQGHGSHTAGTIAGVGVNSDGTPYAGLYNTTAPYNSNLRIGPGVAPDASLYALRVFGCGGSTNYVTAAIDWATDPNNDGDLSDRLDVINMSLGSPFGLDFDADAVASNNATLTGMIVVAAAGNDGDTFFIHSTPAAGSQVISAAAVADAGVPGALLVETAPTAESFAAAAAGYTNPVGDPPPPPPSGQSSNVVQVLDATGGLSQACGSFSNAAAIAGNIALIDRGACNFTLKVLNAQSAGAIGVIVANNTTDTVPAVMGGVATAQINIPGISVSKATGVTLKGQLAGGAVAATLAAADAGDTLASFSSRGPGGGDGTIALKPDIAAPGVDVPSVQTGYTCDGSTTTGCISPDSSGFIPDGQLLVLSGTSMATPHIAGMMALLRQLNPGMSVADIKALAMNSANHDVTLGADATPPVFGDSRVGAGRIDAALASTSKLIATNADVPGAVSVTFDVDPVGVTSATHSVRLTNRTAFVQNVSLALDTVLDSPGVSFSVPATVSIPAGGSTTFDVTMNADASQMTRYIDPSMATSQSSQVFGFALPRHYLAEESALLKVTDGSGDLARLPVYMAHRPHSNMAAAGDLGSSAPASGTTNLALSGQDVCTGTIDAGPTCNADLAVDQESLVSPFELQVTGAKDDALPGFANLHYVGVNSGPDGASYDYFFGIAAHGKWNTPTDASYNVCIDSNNDGLFDKILANTDLGTIDQLFGATATSQDTFVAMIYDNDAGTIGVDFPLNLLDAGVLDSGALSNNTMILGAWGTHLAMPDGASQLHYGVAVCPGWNPLCGAADWTSVGTANCGTPDSAYQSFNGPYVYDAATPGVDGDGNALFEDLNGATLDVAYNVNNLVANGSSGMLLLHTHNTADTSAQVVVLDRIFADGFESP